MAMQADDHLRKGPWLEEEDERLIDFVSVFGQRRWDALAKASGLRRSGKSCRLRWMNYLRPNLKHGHITQEEQLLIIQLHKQWGNRWSRIARRLPGRTDNEIKNYWRSHSRKKASTLEQESVNEALVSPCSSNEEWNSAGKCDHLGISDKSSHEFDLSEFELSCSSPYEARLTDWISNWSGKEPNETEENINCCKTDLFYSPMELISGYSDSDTIICDTSFSIWDMNYK